MRKSKFSPEVRERAVRMMLDHRHEHPSLWAATRSVAGKMGCTAQTLHSWLQQHERDAGQREGSTASERHRGKAGNRADAALYRHSSVYCSVVGAEDECARNLRAAVCLLAEDRLAPFTRRASTRLDLPSIGACASSCLRLR